MIFPPKYLYLIFLAFPNLAVATHSINKILEGQATYTNDIGRGNCSLPLPTNQMVTALNPQHYENASLCGAYLQVKGPEGIIRVLVTNLCPECPGDFMDLSRKAYGKIGSIPAGIIPIEWQVISPNINKPIIYHFKKGSNPYWTAIQIRRHRNPIARFEYRQTNGVFKTIPRTSYNYFVATKGMGSGPFVFRVTDVYGHVLTDFNIPFGEGKQVVGSAQFPQPK